MEDLGCTANASSAGMMVWPLHPKCQHLPRQRRNWRFRRVETETSAWPDGRWLTRWERM